MFPSDIKKLLKLAFEKKLTFAVYQRPGTPAPVLIGPMVMMEESADRSKEAGFHLDTFFPGLNPGYYIPSDNHDRRLRDALNAPDLHDIPTVMRPERKSTDMLTYRAMFGRIMNRLRGKDHKTVIARTIAGHSSGIDWITVAEQYFDLHPDTFRFFFFSIPTGGWLGASPEMLAVRNAGSDTVNTMSFAGTMAADSNEPWDEKNIKEQGYVTRYIVDKLTESIGHPQVNEPEDVRFGNIKHICQRISITYDGPIEKFIATIHPTPALMGYPAKEAFFDIIDNERAPRYCYGGFVGVNDELGECYYVNLRSLHFDGSNYCIYAGGGLTEMSDVDTEWRETEAKAQGLLDIINNS